jgi:hypothetical protein
MTTKTKCDKIFYFRIGIDPDPKNQYDLLDARNCISNTLELYKFRHVDSTGSQASFKPKGHFEIFKLIVELTAERHNIRIRDVKYCDDPGLGLFWD